MRRKSHEMTGLTRWGACAIVVFGLGGCSSMDSGSNQPGMAKTPVASSASMGNPKDGELPYPLGYMIWPKFITDVHKPDANSGSLREQYRSND